MRIIGRNNANTRRGLSLPEVLISLTITAMLLTAVGAAFSASASAIDINDRFFRATQASRVSMEQLCSLLRRATSFDLGNGNYGSATSFSATSINITYIDPVDGSTKSARYQYNATSKELQLVIGTNTYPLAHNVTGVTFTSDLGPIGNYANTPLNCAVDITVAVGNEEVHIRGSAVPHYAVIYR